MPETAAVIDRQPNVETARPPSPRMMWHVAKGEFNHAAFDKRDPQEKVTEVHENAYKALNAQHDKSREAWEQKRLEGITDGELLKSPGMVRHVQMWKWSGMAALGIEHMVNNAPDNTAVISVLRDKLGFPITPGQPVDRAAIAHHMYEDTGNPLNAKDGKFYKEFCTGDVNRKLTAALTVQDMYTIRPFLEDFLGSPQAFDALVLLRQTESAIATNTLTEDVLNKAGSLQATDAPVLFYFRQGLELAQKAPIKAPNPTPHSSEEKKQSTDTTEHLLVLTTKGASVTEAHEDHPDRNDDTLFFDEKNGRGGIFDGAGGYKGGDVASRAAQDAVQRVMGTLSPNSTEQDVQIKLVEAFREANSAVKRIQQATGNREASTTGAVFQIIENSHGKKIIIGNVGDSRVWLRTTNGEVVELTKDQGNLRDNFKSGRISEERYKELREILANAHNEDELKAKGLSDTEIILYWRRRNITHLLGADPTPDFFDVDLPEGATIFMTTDGVHDNLTNDEIRAIAQTTQHASELAKALVTQAKEVSKKDETIYPRAKPDDITAGAILITNAKQPETASAIPAQHPSPEATSSLPILKTEADYRQEVQRLLKELGMNDKIADITGTSPKKAAELLESIKNMNIFRPDTLDFLIKFTLPAGIWHNQTESTRTRIIYALLRNIDYLKKHPEDVKRIFEFSSMTSTLGLSTSTILNVNADQSFEFKWSYDPARSPTNRLLAGSTVNLGKPLEESLKAMHNFTLPEDLKKKLIENGVESRRIEAFEKWLTEQKAF